MTEKAFDIRDEIIEGLRADLKYEQEDHKFAVVTAFLFGILVGGIAGCAIVFGF